MSLRSDLLFRIVRGSLLLVSGTVLLISVAAWILPLEAAQAWAMNRAPKDDFSQFEAYSASAAALWFVRWITLGLGLFLTFGCVRHRKLVPFLIAALTGFRQATDPDLMGSLPKSAGKRIRAFVPGIMIIAWIGLAIIQLGSSIQRRLWEWPIYGLRSGHEVLPNLSDSNLEVIRYLEEVTPPGSRILVFSDQKLYFLSYYLLPRRIFHPIHPNSQFVIARPNNEQELAAYRPSEVDAERVRKLHPDYILEYFEGTSYLDGTNRNRDAKWVEFISRRYGPWARSKYLVALRPYREGASP